MSLWEFMSCIDGYVAANGGKKGRPVPDISEQRLAELGIEGF